MGTFFLFLLGAFCWCRSKTDYKELGAFCWCRSETDYKELGAFCWCRSKTDYKELGAYGTNKENRFLLVSVGNRQKEHYEKIDLTIKKASEFL